MIKKKKKLLETRYKVFASLKKQDGSNVIVRVYCQRYYNKG